MKKLLSIIGLCAISFMEMPTSLDACQATHRCGNGETITCNGDRRCSSGPGYVNCYNNDGSFSSSTCGPVQ